MKNENLQQQKLKQHPNHDLNIKSCCSTDPKADQLSISSHFIGDYHTAPTYMKDNDRITHGYRINFDTSKKILKSLFMIHNESVNIWSHCLPGLFIIIFLISFCFILDTQKFQKSFNSYKVDVQRSFAYYSHAVNNLSLMIEYDKFKIKTATQIQQIKQNAISSYLQFLHHFNNNTNQIKQIFNHQIEGFRSNIQTIKQRIQANIKTFEKAKINFENIVAPMLINQVNQKFNNTFVNEIKEAIRKIKKQFDSDLFRQFELHNQIPNPNEISRWPIFIFLGTAAICLLCSALFHLYYPMSYKIYTLVSRFDFAGIILLISGSGFPPVYYGLYCQMDVAILYLSTFMTMATIVFIICLFKWIHLPEHLVYRSILFVALSMTLLIPLIHIMMNELFFDNLGDPFVFSTSIPYYLLLISSYLVGVYIYTIRCPERNNPGKYNLCGHSHQIWHGFVILGIVFTYLGALQNFEMRKVSTCPI